MDDYLNSMFEDLNYQTRRATEAAEQFCLSLQSGDHDTGALNELADALAKLTTRINQIKLDFDI